MNLRHHLGNAKQQVYAKIWEYALENGQKRGEKKG
jgi:hypothetical protein